MAGCAASILMIGLADYWSGIDYSSDVFYLIPIVFAVWFVGRWFGIVTSVICVATSAGVNGLPRMPSLPLLVILWNSLILWLFYLVVVWILALLRDLQRQLEERVHEQTLALLAEMAERRRLEKELLSVIEREQQRIGSDLHDSLCQHLTAVALAGKVLSDQLSAQPHQADAARKLVEMAEDGIVMARNLAQGLSPVRLEADGLMESLEGLAENITSRFHMDCRFICEVPVLFSEVEMATHLYRIVQEAISNAIRHGQARHVTVQLTRTETGTVLEIADDGSGMSDDAPLGRGMGLRIMRCRATLIGGNLTIRPGASRGTVVTCSLPSP